MTAIPQTSAAAPAASRPLSRRLAEPLDMVAGRVRVLAFLEACLQLMVFAGAAWLVVVLVLGTMRDVPLLAAIALAAAAWASVAAGISRFFTRAVRRRRDLSSAALLADAAMPGTHERISSAIEISQEADPRFRGSPELVACLIRQAEKDADKLDPNAAVSGAGVMRWFGLLVPLALAWLIVLFVKTPNVMLGIRRTLNPWINVASLPTVILDVEPGDTTVAQGDSVTIDLTVKPAPGAVADASDKNPRRAAIVRHFTVTGAGADQNLTADMDPTGADTFHFIAINLEQSFSYRVTCQGAQSQAYTVTVLPRPAAAHITVAYDYPKYTHLQPRSETSHDGAIDAVVGTQVKLTVESEAGLKSAKMLIEDNAPNSGTLDLVPEAPASPRYSATFTLAKTTQYHIELLNAHDLKNTDNQGRPITARIDMPPAISILSPVGMLKVQPGDVVPVTYSASDDFGVARIEALIQVDDKAPIALTIPLESAGKWSLSLPEILRQYPGLDAKSITYQLRATDNREPLPQTALSAKQALEIDKAVAPLAQRLDSQAVEDLAQAVKKARRDLQEAKAKLDQVQQASANKSLDDKQKEQLNDARSQIARARQELATAADKAADSRQAAMAKTTRGVADNPMLHAEENAADARLAADQPDARNQNAAGAKKNIDDAERQLAALAGELQNEAKEQPLAQEAERLKSEQQRLAGALEKNPRDPKLLAQQRDLEARTEQMIKEHPELQKPVAEANQAKVDALARQIQQIESSQAPLDENLQNQAEAPGTQEQLRDPQSQEALNRQIAQFNQEQSQRLKESGGKMPGQKQLDQIAKDKSANKPQLAAQEQQGAAMQLDDAAGKLDAAAKRDQDAADNPKADDVAAQAVKDAAALKDKVDKLAEQIQQANKNHTPPAHPGDAANQQASHLADELKRQAQQLGQKPGTRDAAQEMVKDAAAARKDVAAGDAAGAQRELAQGAAQASAAAAEAMAESPKAQDAKATADAEDQAHDLADQQHALAEQTRDQMRALDQAREGKNHSAETTQQQQDLAGKIDQAAKGARSLADQTRGGAPEMSQRAAKAADSLQKAQRAQRAAAAATEQGDAAQGAAGQDQALNQAADAEEALTGRPSAFRRQRNQVVSAAPRPRAGAGRNVTPPSPQNSAGASGQPGDSGKQGSSGANSQQTASASGSKSSAGQPGSGQSAQGSSGSAGSSASAGSSGAGGQAGNAGSQGASGAGGQQTAGAGGAQSGAGRGSAPQSAQGSGGSGGAPGQGGDASSKTVVAGGQQSAGAGGSPSGHGASQTASASDSSSGASGHAKTGGGIPGTGQGGAAQSAQAAREAQDRAAHGEPGAAREASGDLDRMLRQLASGSVGGASQQGADQSPSSGSAGGRSGAGGTGNTQSASVQGSGGSAGLSGGSAMGGSSSGQTGVSPHSGGGSGSGVAVAAGGHSSAPPPKSVQDIGVSPSDWARLSPLMQDQLLHSAQESGPPSYHDMIKNYYSRIARLQDQGGAP